MPFRCTREAVARLIAVAALSGLRPSDAKTQNVKRITHGLLQLRYCSAQPVVGCIEDYDNDDAANDGLVVQGGDVGAISRSLPVPAARALEHDPEKCAAVFRKIMLEQ